MNTNIRERQHKDIGEDVYEYYQFLTDKVTGGEFQNVSFLSFDSSEPPCPIGPGQFTRLKLTDGSCQITSFQNSFIQLEIRTELKWDFEYKNMFSDILAAMGGVEGPKMVSLLTYMPILYVGFKSGLHAIDHYRFYNSLHPGPLCEQSQAIYESALTYMTKSEEEITNKLNRYAVPDELDEGKEDVPGVFLTFGDLISANAKPVTFTVNIPYDDFAPLQFFKNYPNSICGDLQLEFKINNNKNFVCYPLNFKQMLIKQIKKTGTFSTINDLFTNSFTTERTATQLSVLFNSFDFDNERHMTNCGDQNGVEAITIADSTGPLMALYQSHVTVSASSLYLISAKSFINCYNIPHERHEQLRDLLSSNKIYIPAQRIDQYTFSQTPTISSMNCNTTQSLVNCSALAFTWPRSPNELTCSINPYMSSIQLQIDNKTYPDKPFSTYSIEHANYILSNLVFDDFFSPNKSLEKSLTTKKEYEENTNYTFIVSLERLDSSPFVFEGLTKDNCYITLNGTFDSSYQPYSSLSSKQNPIMFVCQDTLWELSTGDINYYYNDRSIIPRISNK